MSRLNPKLTNTPRTPALSLLDDNYLNAPLPRNGDRVFQLLRANQRANHRKMARLTPDNETVALNSNCDRIHLKITSPSAGVPADLAYHVPAATTVNDIKSMISESLDSKPANDMQKLIYRGRILDGASTIGEAVVLGSVSYSSIPSPGQTRRRKYRDPHH
jgi:hypothetical protein